MNELNLHEAHKTASRSTCNLSVLLQCNYVQGHVTDTTYFTRTFLLAYCLEKLCYFPVFQTGYGCRCLHDVLVEKSVVSLLLCYNLQQLHFFSNRIPKAFIETCCLGFVLNTSKLSKKRFTTKGAISILYFCMVSKTEIPFLHVNDTLNFENYFTFLTINQEKRQTETSTASSN